MWQKIAGRKLMIWCGWVTMSCRHHVRHILWNCLRLNFRFLPNRLQHILKIRVCHGFSQLVDIFLAVVAIVVPYIQQFLQTTVVLWISLLIKTGRKSIYLDQVRLQCARQRRKRRRAVQVVLGVVKEVVEQVDDVQSLPLGRWLSSFTHHRQRFSAWFLDLLKRSSQRREIFPQDTHAGCRFNHVLQDPCFAGLGISNFQERRKQFSSYCYNVKGVHS